VKRGYRRYVPAVTVAALLSGACQGPARTATPVPSLRPTTPSPVAGTPVPTTPSVDPASVHADELGAVPVLMYHQLLARPRGDYDQTPAQFRAELETLYGHGFRTVTAASLVAGHPDVPAGRSPMVLTFDDSTVSQYRELPDGSVDPGCALGILLSVAKAHGEARPVASLYVNAAPFAGKDAYLARLVALGMELGDHTATHADLRELGDTAAQRELAAGLGVITADAPGAAVTTMALPYGATPRHASLAHTGKGYDFAGVLLVGSNPAPSPYAKTFDPLAVPRIRSGLRTGVQLFTSTYWVPRLLDGRVRRYVSDGDPAHVSFPRADAARLSPRFKALARPY